MVAIKTADVDAFVARPSDSHPIILVFGPDAGLVRERAEKLAANAVDNTDDPFALVRLPGDTVAADPARLVDEASTIPLFGGRRAIWVKVGGRDNIVPAVEMLLAAPPRDCRIVIEAGDLRRNAPLRVACERAKNAVALPCYSDGDRELIRLIDDEMRQAGLDIMPDARAALLPFLGGDRQSSRSEIRKLALYAHGRGRVTVEDVMAVVADASSTALDDVIDAACAGRLPELETSFTKALADGTSAGSILSAASRHVAQLHKLTLAVESGSSIDSAIGAMRPPLHFSRKDAMQSALRRWTPDRATRAMIQLSEAILETRKRPELANAIAQRALMNLATAARKK
jgi:DNA polymerase-3 subunit delta